ncbi:MAG: hypothetical protein FWD94_07790 [Treponema sp.]|nr:hypothetical protein [Treponema sp.]
MKCFFDNPLPPLLAKALNTLESAHGIPVVHLKEKFEPSTPDVEWIKKLAEEGGWFVITKDTKIRRNPYEKQVWKESGLSIVFLERTLAEMDFWELSWRMVRYWGLIKESISRGKEGESFSVNINGKIR